MTIGVLVKVSITVKRHHNHSNSYKGQHLIGAGLKFQRCSPLLTLWEDGSAQADIVLEKDLRGLDLDQGHQETVSHWAYLEQIRPQGLPHSDTLPPAGSHIFQQGYASLPGVPLPFGVWEPIAVKLPHLDPCRRPSSTTSLVVRQTKPL